MIPPCESPGTTRRWPVHGRHSATGSRPRGSRARWPRSRTWRRNCPLPSAAPRPPHPTRLPMRYPCLAQWIPSPPRRLGRTADVLRIRALGEATVSRGDVPVTAADWGYAKPRELLFLLATSRPLTREQVGAALWPEQPAHQLGNSLHTALRGLRRALGRSDWVLYSDRRYSLNIAGEYDCDVATFELALAEARNARGGDAALPELQRAVAAYGGDFLAGLGAGEWAAARRQSCAAASSPHCWPPAGSTPHSRPPPGRRHGLPARGRPRTAERDRPPRADGIMGQPGRNRPRRPPLRRTHPPARRAAGRAAIGQDHRAVPAAARPALSPLPPSFPLAPTPIPQSRLPAWARARPRMALSAAGPIQWWPGSGRGCTGDARPDLTGHSASRGSHRAGVGGAERRRPGSRAGPVRARGGPRALGGSRRRVQRQQPSPTPSPT